MKTLYLHIGQAKTGTTAIQHYCSQHKEQLSKLGLRYIRLGMDLYPHNHKAIHYALLAKSGGYPRDRNHPPMPFSVLLESLGSEIRESQNSKLLISFEGLAALSQYAPRSISTLMQFRKRILPHANIRIIYYIRDPMSILVSNYNQRSKKQGGIGPFLDFVMQSSDGVLDQSLAYRFFASVFGRKNIIVKHYGELRGPEFIHDFLSTLGIQFEETQDTQPANPGLPESAVELSRIRACIFNTQSHDDMSSIVMGDNRLSPEDLIAFTKRLTNINRNNRWLFRRHTSVSIKPIHIVDLILAERRLNHNALALHYIQSVPELNQRWNEAMGQIGDKA